MQWFDWLLLAVIAGAVVLAVRSLRKNKHSCCGSCSGACSGCASGSQCASKNKKRDRAG